MVVVLVGVWSGSGGGPGSKDPDPGSKDPSWRVREGVPKTGFFGQCPPYQRLFKRPNSKKVRVLVGLETQNLQKVVAKTRKNGQK